MSEGSKFLKAEAGEKLDRSRIPQIVFERHPEYVELYDKAWELAADHIYHDPRMPEPRYMGEGCNCGRVWIWDTCFMVHFCKYSAGYFPGTESLENLYRPLHDSVPTACRIHHVDNPPLFAWLEYEYAKFSGDISRLRRVLTEKKYLQKHYEMIEHAVWGQRFPCGFCICKTQKFEEKGFYWTGNSSGMDNTPRGNDCGYAILWVDLMAQQALSALYISRLAEMTGDRETQAHYEAEYRRRKDIINRYYYDRQDGVYYDISDINLEPCRVLTPASFWPILAECASMEQLERQIAFAMTPERLGGDFPLNSLSRDSRFYSPDGNYWRGGIWLPTSYMTIKSLEHYGKLDLAADLARKTIDLQYRTYRDVEPHTIWECYSPSKPYPSTEKTGKLCRRDFCGWSALGPISLLIENVIGLYDVNAFTRTAKLHRKKQGVHGIRNFRFADITADIIISDDGIDVATDKPFTLEVAGRPFVLEAGKNEIRL